MSRSFSSSVYCLEEESSQPAAISKVDLPSNSTKSIGLLAGEDANAEPTLEYLDSLKPRPRRSHNQQHSKRHTSNPFSKSINSKPNADDKLWERTRTRITSSFTRDQLASLARAAKLPGSYAKTVRKNDIVRRIMVHRFGMEDARERADREKREESEKRTVHFGFRPAELYLLLARGSGRVRQEAGRAQVAILPQSPNTDTGGDGGSEKLGFWIRGKDQGIARMNEWVEEFKLSIKSKEEQVVLSAESRQDEAGVSEVLPAELVRLISQLSRCFMEASPIQNGKVTLSLAYLDERDAQKAVLLLRQYHAESAKAMHRLGAAAYRNNVDSTRKCSMLPFVPNEPTPWIKQADDLLYGSPSDVSFRMAHVPQLNAFSMLSTAKLTAMKVDGWGSHGAAQFDEPFKALVGFASSSAAEKAHGMECSAELGHVLFNAGGLALADEGLSEEEILSRLQDPLAAPLPGTWPIETALDWARRFRSRFGREASRFVPATLFRSSKNDSLDIWLERQGYAVADEGMSEAATEQVVLIYQPSETGYLGQGRKLEIILTRQQSEIEMAEGAKGGWGLKHARWVSEAQSDLMVPEKGADLRLSAKVLVPLETEVLAAVEDGLATYLSPKQTGKEVEAVEVAEEEAEEADVDAGDVLGVETEVVEASTTKEVRPTSAATLAGALPPSLLEVESVGKLALESVTRSTVQMYVQRTTLDAGSASQSAAQAQNATDTAAEAATEGVDAFEQLSTSSESDAIPSTAITTAEVGASSTSPPETPESEATSPSLSPTLIREISQDLVTKTTSESLRLTWRCTDAPGWTSVVEPISALVDRHDLSIR